MTRPLPFTQSKIRRAIKAADKEGKRVVLRPDGSITFEERDNPQDGERREDEHEIVL